MLLTTNINHSQDRDPCPTSSATTKIYQATFVASERNRIYEAEVPVQVMRLESVLWFISCLNKLARCELRVYILCSQYWGSNAVTCHREIKQYLQFEGFQIFYSLWNSGYPNANILRHKKRYTQPFNMRERRWRHMYYRRCILHLVASSPQTLKKLKNPLNKVFISGHHYVNTH